MKQGGWGFGVGGLDPWWGVLGLQVLEATVVSRTGSLARVDASPLPRQRIAFLTDVAGLLLL